MSLLVAQEVVLGGELGILGHAIIKENHILYLKGDGAKESRQYDVVHAPQYRSGGLSNVKADVVVKGIMFQGEEDEVVPLRVVGGEGFRTTTTSNFKTIVVDCSFSRALTTVRIQSWPSAEDLATKLTLSFSAVMTYSLVHYTTSSWA